VRVLFFEDVINNGMAKLDGGDKNRGTGYNHWGAIGVKSGRKNRRKQRPMSRNLELGCRNEILPDECPKMTSLS
jgi:hypothetical protein